ncbi:peptidoglycan DD-metalloendopeptidase family protein [Elongatibacter sediminis]|uniref:Peptidoglycan DD-metalloendopeptidase family protein n=1 Tax=Elongatibacter sediminis TaxID=3119006 RepID=A0AAW9RIA9_9GAMM
MNRTGIVSAFLIALIVSACAGPPPAPVVDRSAGQSYAGSTPDGHYRVRRGDTLYAIAFRYGLDWRELAHWNQVRAPYVILPDQLLRLSPQRGSTASTVSETRQASTSGVVTRPAAGTGRATTRALDTPRASTVDTAPKAVEAPAQPPPPATQSTATRTETRPPPPQAAPVSGADPSQWLWPTEGRVLGRFIAGDPSRKGIDIAGKAGQPVTAAAGGQVVYSGSGLIGYGELIIIKHSDRMLSAYAHNSRRLVSEGQQVAAGAKIAEMGTNDRNQEVLHFEIRVNGTPRDPLDYLPSR